MSEFNGISATDLVTLKADIVAAKHYCQKCNDSLLISPDGLKNEIKELLVDTFSITGSDRDQVNEIRLKFLAFASRIDNSDFNGVSEENAPAEAKTFAAYVKSNDSKNIFLVQPKFFTNTDKERALTLIHEYIHLLNPGDGHPGFENRIPIIFDRQKLNVPFDKAILNAYCYHYYAHWLPS